MLFICKTMAKVIMAVLKFSDEEKRKIIDNEKLKNAPYLFSLGK